MAEHSLIAPPLVRRVAFVGNYLPRRCGIATFTTDLAEAMAQAWPEVDFLAVAMTDTPDGYPYPPRVPFSVPDQDLDAYVRAADFINGAGVDAVSLQHEYGIFGGKAGAHITTMLDELRVPVATTLHTVLRDPDPPQRAVMDAVVQRSERLVVMNQCARRYLEEIYLVDGGKIDVIPHGVPDIRFADPDAAKAAFGVAGRDVLLTFGLISPNKGIEHVIRALPEIADQFPEVLYIVLGDLHPRVREAQGDSYLDSLQDLAGKLGVERHVRFDRRFVELSDLVAYLEAADIYVTPYLNQAQIVSGTLAYAVGAGKAIVSTPYWYASELLADGRGRIVPFADHAAIAMEITTLLGDDRLRMAIRKKAYALGRSMIWPEIAKRFMATFESAVALPMRLPLAITEREPVC